MEVTPVLTLGASLRSASGHYVVKVGKRFTISGTSKPHLSGRTIDYTGSTTARWLSATSPVKLIVAS